MLRTYRFPPLDLLQAARISKPLGVDADTVPTQAAPDPQALAQAYEQAAQRGHAEGFAQGQQEGLQSGQQQGYATGLAEGHAQAQQTLQQDSRAELTRLATPLDALTTQLRALHEDWQASLGKDVIDLVERVARQVVRCELTLQPAQILALVQETLEGMPQRTGSVQVFLNPADLQRIEELDAGRVPAWHLHADSALEAGECRLRVGEAEVDAGCKHRLQACMEQVREQLVPEEAQV